MEPAPSAEKEVDTFADPPSSSVANAKCEWLMLVGDSNMRHIAPVVVSLLKRKRNGGVVTTVPRIGKATQTPSKYHTTYQKCEQRWADNEYLVTHNQFACTIVTQRFMTSQNEIQRIVADARDDDYCGTHLVDLAPDLRPESPSLVWFAHGLWGLPDGGSPPQREGGCEDRFRTVVSGLKSLERRSDVVWQTNFPINHHPRIRNSYLKWEVDCQRAVGAKYNITLFDLDQYVRPRMPGAVSDFHVSAAVTEYVASVILDGGKTHEPSPEPHALLAAPASPSVAIVVP